jgi:hypothetical protein
MALVMALTAQSAGASVGSVRADSDGYVPVSYSCFGGGAVGLYSWFSNGDQTYGKITINQCLLESLGAGPQDFARVLAHEMGHSKGLLHNSYASSVMQPILSITGG